MTLIDKLITHRVAELLSKLESISEEIVEELERKQSSLAVADLTTSKEIPKHLLSKIAIIHMQLIILRGLISEKSD